MLPVGNLVILTTFLRAVDHNLSHSQKVANILEATGHDLNNTRNRKGTEVQLLYILILRQTCLVVLVAKHPILYIASLFFYIPL